MITAGITPDYAIGDFDSISSSGKYSLLKSSVKQFPREKDETDFELADLCFTKEPPGNLYMEQLAED
ncbi:hypothetical protein KHA80_19505 [Anaerobacillus sp. HL2]|nr:hypothetical protein KHA80_19505 [Anaerobacillus sp. HL2]